MFKDRQTPQDNSNTSQLLGLHFTFLKYRKSVNLSIVVGFDSSIPHLEYIFRRRFTYFLTTTEKQNLGKLSMSFR